MRHMMKVRAALTVVLIGLFGAALVLGHDSDTCREAYLGSGLAAQQMSFAEFRSVYNEPTCATGGEVVYKNVDFDQRGAAETSWAGE